MVRNVSDFLNEFKYEKEATLKLFKVLTDDVLDNRVYNEGRTLCRLANHIIETLSEMPHHAGLPIEEAVCEFNTAADLYQAYLKYATQFEDVLAKSWTDAMMTDMIPMYGMEWSKGTVLQILLSHQTHHRAQMTVLMRQAGLIIPGMYGPAKEEWLAMGREALN
jgi:uncharacterized damage-inducible protein DinB